MQKVISINLNGNAYQLEEGGYDALQRVSGTRGSGAQRQPGSRRNHGGSRAGDRRQVPAVSRLAQVGGHLRRSGADHRGDGAGHRGTGAGTGEQNGADGAKPEGGAAAATAPPPKRLYRIPDGAMIAGVCSGLAAYFQIDVTLVRIGFVVLALLTKGVGILIYVAMMFLVPEANTPEERAAAGGMPFNAKEVVDRVKREYEKGSKHWTREWRRKQRQWRRAGLVGRGRRRRHRGPSSVLPLFGLVHLILFLIAAGMMISLVNTGAILSWQKPPDVPLWAAALVLFIAYQIVVSPFRARAALGVALRRAVRRPDGSRSGTRSSG